ncbi:MAG TPA: FAD-dependent oxidoreductase, partial [Dissulfurispiraceae bacterium]|nr:FAD-dependent oxidoreductase [Dissulfurispiraceae bacterium]
QVQTNRTLFRTKGIVIASGADSKKLGVTGENELSGKGVSYCAECDGYFYKNGKQVIVVGGGDTAATDALYLHGLGAKVTVVHHRDALRAEKHLQESLAKTDVTIRWNSAVEAILGDRTVEGVRIRNVQTGEEAMLPAQGVFIAIGYSPNTDVARMLNLSVNEYGYIVVDSHQRTTLPLVYAAGDVTGGIKQIAVAVGQGTVAAISAFEDITSPYWTKKAQ